jgi:hypothetical protein
MAACQIQDKRAILDLCLSKSGQARARWVFTVFEHLLCKTSAIFVPEAIHLGGVSVCFLFQEFFGFGLSVIGVKQPHAEEMLLRIGYLTEQRPNVSILDSNTCKDFVRRVPLVLPGFVDK